MAGGSKKTGASEQELAPLPDWLELDKEGYLVNLDDWDHDVADLLATREAIDLTDEHWEIITLLRNFYSKSGHSPSMRPLVKLVRTAMGDVKGNSLYLLQLFPDSPATKAAKIAGLPRPTNCL